MRPRRVAIVANNLHTYQIKIVCGISDVLRVNGVDSLLILGQSLRPPDTGPMHANDVYGLIDGRNFCGVIVLSTVVGPQVSDEALSEWIRTFSLPVVSIGRPLRHAGNVLIDNVPGMSALMTHLLDTMGYRKLAMLRGIPGNADSEERESVFRASLEGRGIPVEDDLLMTGDFASVKAFRLVQELLNRRRDVQAIVCANDDMADGCVRAVNAAGLRVPQDVAVVGFDDAIHHVVPALTTVRMPVYEQGREAALMLLTMLEAPAPQGWPDTRVLQAELVVRESCGAGGRHASARSMPAGASVSKGGIESYLADPLRRWMARFDEMAPDAERHQAFLEAWNEALSRRPLIEVEYPMWRDQFAGVVDRDHADPTVARLALAALSSLAGVIQRDNSRRHSLRAGFGEMVPRLFNCESHEHLRHELSRFLRHVGLDRHAMVLYERFESVIPERSRLVLDSSGTAAADESWFPTRDILPAAVWGRLTGELLVLTPLLVNAIHYGLIVYEPPSWWGPYPDTSFSHTISHAISQVENTIAARDYALQLEGLVKARTAALEAQVAETLRAQQALRLANASLQHTAFHDGLTQLFNRTAFDTHFENQWNQHMARQRPLSVLLCDVDHFKKYNDLHGHVMGDECLRQIAQALRSAVRGEHDIVARYGGEEFVLVLPSTDLTLAVVVAERIQQEVRKLQLRHGADGAGEHVTVSIGVATTHPRSDVTKQSLIELADDCLYQAKSTGRARCVSADMA
ncbi:diguanylate cyclase domain-containing protein [Mitsuaria sp. 7]|uniref:diguanylate cyclase domain-containing protein n=1 Tax=Mitsuaria sp. 7 TaxID=1658665 RepID=UPI00082C7D58|nr:diguanylate cyclase [Mitsuaria sp. 7]